MVYKAYTSVFIQMPKGPHVELHLDKTQAEIAAYRKTIHVTMI